MDEAGIFPNLLNSLSYVFQILLLFALLNF